MQEVDGKDIVDEDVGGVQGSDPGGADPQGTGLNVDSPAPAIRSGVPDQPAPDAGEIEWAGALVRKPPAAE